MFMPKNTSWLLILMSQAFITLTTEVRADSYLARYLCIAQGDMRQNGGQSKVHSRMEFRVYQDDEGNPYLTRGVGHVLVGEKRSELLSQRYAYYGLFQFHKIRANPNYRPVKYTHHYQFKPFHARFTNKVDGGGMWGYWVMPKTLDKTLKAHYVFQAGSHMGGTIDYNCQ